MKRNLPVYAESFGVIYKFSAHKWKQMLTLVANGESVDYDDFGNVVCIVAHNITDLDEEMARELQS